MRMVVLGFAAAFVVLKDLAIAWAGAAKLLIGARLVERLRNGDGAELEHFPALANPIDRLLLRVAGGSSPWARIARFSFTAPVVIVGGSAVAFVFSDRENGLVTLALGIALATCSTLVVLTAVVRRLLFGAEDWKTSDVRIPAFKPFAGWAMTREKGANRSVYFLVIVYLSVLGFASLYLAIGVADPSAFEGVRDSSSRVTWLYFSLTTLATVGYGDIHPASTGAMIATSGQIAAGALLLSWLLAAFLSSPAPDERAPHEPAGATAVDARGAAGAVAPALDEAPASATLVADRRPGRAAPSPDESGGPSGDRLR